MAWEVEADICRSRHTKTCIICYDTYKNVNKNKSETCSRQCHLILQKRMSHQKNIAHQIIAVTCTCKNVVGTDQRYVGEENIKLEFKCTNCNKDTKVWVQ